MPKKIAIPIMVVLVIVIAVMLISNANAGPRLRGSEYSLMRLREATDAARILELEEEIARFEAIDNDNELIALQSELATANARIAELEQAQASIPVATPTPEPTPVPDPTPTPKPRGVNMRVFNLLENGMSISEVRNIIGTAPSSETVTEVLGTTTTMMVWMNTQNFSTITVMFTNGYATAISQTGL